MKRLVRLATTAALAAVSLACGRARTAPPRTPRARPAKPAAKLAADNTCHALRHPLEPSLEAWDADDRARIRALGRHGAVAVRYFVNGCGAALEVLPGCTADAQYAFAPAPAKRHSFLWKRRDLLSGFPLGAPALVGAVADHRVLRLDVSELGALSLPAIRQSYPAYALHGPQCAEATHVVGRIVVGSFELAIGGGAIHALASQGPVTSDVDVLADEGYIAGCAPGREDASGAPLCATALRVDLLPIAGVPQAAPACAPGKAWVGAACVPRLGWACSGGMHHDAKRGCVPDDAGSGSADTLATWYAEHERDAAAAQRSVGVAYQIAEMRFVGGTGDPAPWWDRTVTAFEHWKKSGGSVDTPEGAMAAEAAYRRLDARIAADFDYSTGHHHYTGFVVDIAQQLKADGAEARKLDSELTHVADDYRQPVWTIAALARQGSLWDSLRKGMVHAREPYIVLFDDHTLHLLAEADASGNAALVRKARAIRTKVRKAWRKRAAREVEASSLAAIVRYAAAVQLARQQHVDNALVERTLRRLEELEVEVGPEKMRADIQTVRGLEYTPGMYWAL